MPAFYNANGDLITAPLTVPDDADEVEVLIYLRDCARRWEPDARLLGNLRSADIVRVVDGLLPRLVPDVRVVADCPPEQPDKSDEQ